MFQGDVYQGNDDYSLGSVTPFGSPDADEEMVGMRGLWCAVIMQAMQDALGKCTANLSQAEKTTAIHWLTNKSRDFDDVCLMASISPAYARQRISEVLGSGFYTWRASPGTGKRYEERRMYRERQKRRQEEKENRRIVNRVLANIYR